jgi:hypothetical protein
MQISFVNSNTVEVKYTVVGVLAVAARAGLCLPLVLCSVLSIVCVLAVTACRRRVFTVIGIFSIARRCWCGVRLGLGSCLWYRGGSSRDCSRKGQKSICVLHDSNSEVVVENKKARSDACAGTSGVVA